MIIDYILLMYVNGVGVTVGDNVVIKDSIIAENVRIGSNCVINRGCLIAHDVVIDDGCVIPEYTRLMSMPQWDSRAIGDIDISDKTQIIQANAVLKPYHVHMLGAKGVGYVWEYRGMLFVRLCLFLHTFYFVLRM